MADNDGSTVQGSGSVGLSTISFPDPAQTPISEFLIQCPVDQVDTNRLFVSLDGGTNYLTLYPGGHWAWTPKGETTDQITLLGNVASVNYEIVANLELD
jgi:hypothetical protein